MPYPVTPLLITLFADSFSSCTGRGPDRRPASRQERFQPASADREIRDRQRARRRARRRHRLPPAEPKAHRLPRRNTLPFATQLSAAPPAKHSLRRPVSATKLRTNRRITSSVTAWIDAA